MKKLKIKDILILYDNSVNIKEIEDIINRNYYLINNYIDHIISLVEIDNNIMYISDFNKWFREVVYKDFNKHIEILKKDNNLMYSYINFINRSKNNYTRDLSFRLISYKCFMEHNKVGEVDLFLRHRHNAYKVIDWAKDKVRYNTYNYLLGSEEKSIFNNSDIYLNTIESYVKNDKSIYKKDVELKYMSEEDAIKLLGEFIHSINAPHEWSSYYNDLVNNNKIVFNYDRDSLRSSCEAYQNGLRLNIKYDGNGFVFTKLVHEFSHYASFKGIPGYSNFLLGEVCSIYFEKLAAGYLSNLGYSGIIDEVNRYRSLDNIRNYYEVDTILKDIALINKGRYINHEVREEESINHIYSLIEENNKYRKYTNKVLFKVPKGVDVDSNIDYLNDELVNNGLYDLLSGYPYILDSYIVDNIYKKYGNNKSITNKMFYINNNLNNLELKDILDILELNDIFKRGKVYEKEN